MATYTRDIMLDDNFNIIIENGDFKLTPSDVNIADQQDVILLLKTYIGNWKQYPEVGVGIDYYLASTGLRDILKRSIMLSLESDGIQTNNIQITENVDGPSYYIDAQRK